MKFIESRPPHTNRGVALMIGLFVVSLATIVASSMLWEHRLSQRRAFSAESTDRARLYALGAEAWAGDILRDDLRNREAAVDSLEEEWAVALPPLPIDGGLIEGYLEDMQGRFNINNLIDASGAPNPQAVEQFRRLLRELELDENLAVALSDWLDLDIEPQFPDGAEDQTYTALELPYRAANLPVTSVSELRSVKGFTVEVFEALRPHIAALPIGSAINLNTATQPVLQSFDIGGSDVANIVDQQCDGGIDSLEEFDEEVRETLAGAAFSSQYFQATVTVNIGTNQLTMYSLLWRNAAGQTKAMIRNFGVETAYAGQPCNTAQL